MLGSILENYLPLQSIDSGGTLPAFSKVVEVDCTAGNIILVLPVIDGAIPRYENMLIKRIDDTVNTLTINGTAGNYEDEGLLLNGLEGTTIYASATIWRSTT